MSYRTHLSLGVAALILLSAQSASAGFISYVIRSTPVIQANNTYTPGATEFIIGGGGQKAGQGSSDIDGSTLGSILNVSIKRWDDESRFTPASGPAVAPYLNFWITDGLGNFAVAANEPSNPDFSPLYNNGWNLSFGDLSNKSVKIYENNNKTWLPNNGVGLTFLDLAGFTIMAPTVAHLTAGWAGLGTGAPRELGTNMAYGVNWIFGDTLSNYVSGQDGYIVSDARVAAARVPEPVTMGLLGLGLVAIARRMRRTL